jgi:hypothetical protein
VDHPYSREQAVYPVASLIEGKYWPPVGRSTTCSATATWSAPARRSKATLKKSGLSGELQKEPIEHLHAAARCAPITRNRRTTMSLSVFDLFKIGIGPPAPTPSARCAPPRVSPKACAVTTC